MEQYKEDFIHFMVDCGVLRFGDFVAKSGRKTPFFINAGNYQTGAQLNALGTYYAKAIRATFGTDFEVLFGPAYKGIPLSVATAMALDREYGAEVRYSSNRKEIKDHGDAGILLGSKMGDGDRVILIEDVTTAGTSIIETVPLLKAQGNVSILGLIISVDRMEKGQNTNMGALKMIEERFGFRTASIVTMADVIEVLYNKEYKGKVIIDDELKQRIDAYYDEFGAR